ncbi:MAG TPA: LysM peptidoglycan-binding domain-containing protein [Allosphingosinicella sp.]|nr:LysM peptidoglycan-binding domain-containing protein [Allosphingosinicella sp.]
MSRPLALIFAFFLTAAAERAPLPHAAGAPAGPGPGCGGGFTAARGDTLYSIARRCETSVTELTQENRLGRPPRLSAGQALAIPGFERAEAPRPPETAPSPSRVRPAVRPPLPPAREERRLYHFQAGDTLYSLARWARTSLGALRAANPDVDPRDIEIGDPIRLPTGAVRPEPLRLRERGRPAPAPAAAPAPPPVASPPRPPRARPALPPPAADDDGKPKPDGGDGEDAVTAGGMDDGGPEPEGM